MLFHHIMPKECQDVNHVDLVMAHLLWVVKITEDVLPVVVTK